MRGRIDRVLEYFTAEPLRVSAWLRLPLIGLIVVLVSIADIDPWFPAAYWAVLAVYTVSALVWVVIAVRGPAWPWAAPVATAVDILAVLALCVAYGPPAADLLPVLFLLPISVAFEDRPGVTATHQPEPPQSSSESSRPQAISGCGSSTRSGTTPWGCRTRRTCILDCFCGWPPQRPPCALCSPDGPLA